MKKVLFALFIACFAIEGFAQNEDAVVIRERNYEGTALYGFMNGGSDLFLEYGFQKLNVREVKYKERNYTIETYTMDTPKNAFGIYSIHIFKPLRADSLLAGKGFDCLSKYQLQAAFSNNYISIVFNDGPVAAAGGEELLMKAIAAIAAEKNEALIFPAEVQELKRPFTGRLQYARGELGLSNADEEALAKYPDTGISYGLWIYASPEGETIYIKDSDF